MAELRPLPAGGAAARRAHAGPPRGRAARERPRPCTRRSTTPRACWTRSIAQPRPRYFAFIGSSGLEIGAIADLLAHTYDINLAVDARAATQIEQQAVRWVGEFVGFPAAIGAFTSGGTISNVTALAAAREQARAGARDRRPVGRRARRSTAPPRCTTRSRGRSSCWGSARTTSATCRSTASPQAAARRARRGDRPRRGRGHHAGRGGRDGGHDADRRDRPDRPRSPTSAPSAACGCTWTVRTVCRPPRSRRTPASSPASSAPTPSPSTRTSGSTCRRRAASCWCASTSALTRAFAHEEGYLPHQQHELHAVDITLEYSRPFRALKLWLAFRVHGAPQFREAIAQNLREADLLFRTRGRRPMTSRRWPSLRSCRSSPSGTHPTASPTSTRTTTRWRRRSRRTGASTWRPR